MRSIVQNLLVIHAVAAVIGVTTLFKPPRATTKYPAKLTDAGKLGVAMGELAAIFVASMFVPSLLAGRWKIRSYQRKKDEQVAIME